MENNMITIGEIINTHGHLGEVRVWPLTDFPERFQDLKQVLINKNGSLITLHIEQARTHKQFIIIKFNEITDMNDADALRGALLQIPMEELKELPENTFYIFDLIGLKVSADTGEQLGRITNVLQTGGNDVYVVKPTEGKEILIPALKHVVKEINTREKTMVVTLLPGLLDIYR